jgi:putative ABC transport system substrate-binding protein
MNKYLLYFIVILSSISCSVHAANTIQILTAKAGDTAELSQYLQKNINDDVIISINHQVDLKADLIIVLNESVIEKLPSERPPTLFVLPQPLAIELQKKDSALYWTPSLAMQLALIKAILPATNRVGMLVSANNEDQSWLRTFKQYAVEKGIEVFIQTLDKSRIGRQVSDLAVSTDVLLAQPDSSIYNRETIRFILLAAYRQNKALIGPSLAFVNAGSLATLYAPSSTINQEILQRVQYFLKQKKLPLMQGVSKTWSLALIHKWQNHWA